MWDDVSSADGVVLRHESMTGGVVSCGRAVLDGARREVGVSVRLGVT